MPTPLAAAKTEAPTDPKKVTAPPGDDGPPLADVIREVSAGLRRLRASGLNRRAIVTLLVASTKVGRKSVERVLVGIDKLAADYTTGDET